MGGDDVQGAVSIHVGQRQGRGALAGTETTAEREVAGAVVQIDEVLRALVALVADDDVQVAIAVHVAQRHARSVVGVADKLVFAVAPVEVASAIVEVDVV